MLCNARLTRILITGSIVLTMFVSSVLAHASCVLAHASCVRTPASSGSMPATPADPSAYADDGLIGLSSENPLALRVEERGAGTSGIDEFHAFVLPETTHVDPDTPFAVQFVVDESAMHFNGYEVTIEFDPGLVTFLGVDEGSLMTSACPNRFRNLATTDSTVTYTHILLCTGVSIDGPGVLSSYRFRSGTPGVSPMKLVSDPDRTFFDDGVYVAPSHPTDPRQVIFHDGRVEIGDVVGVGDSSDDPDLPQHSRAANMPTPRIEVRPQPLSEGGWIHLFWQDHELGRSTTPMDGPIELQLLDASGRIRGHGVLDNVQAVSSLSWARLAPTDLPSGSYWIRAVRHGSVAAERVVFVR